MKSKIIAIVFLFVMIIVVPVEALWASPGTSLSLKDFYDELSAKDNKTYVEYVMDGGLNSPVNPDYLEPDESLVLGRPYRYGYTFCGWYFDPFYRYKVKKIAYIKDKSFVLYAKWNVKIDNYYNVENYNYESKNTLKQCDYSFLDKLNIPGMPDTKEDDFFNNLIFSQSQCPQGLCVANEFILITSYSEGEECMGEIMVFDKDSGEYLFTLGMDSDSHLGGIAFDGKNIWVCNSAEKSIERLSYDFVENMAKRNSGGVVDAREVVDIYPVKNTPSCITYYGNRLWIATHTLVFKSHMVAYYYDTEADELKKLSKYTIPAKVQGVSFDKSGQIYLSTSYGRTTSSYLKVYNSIVDMDSQPDKPTKSIELPPCSEEVDIIGDKLYMIFESAGEKYFEGTDGKGLSASPLDKILVLKTNSL